MKRKFSIFALLALLPVLIFFGCNKDIPVDPNAPSIDNTYIVALDLSKDNSIQSNAPAKDRISGFIASRGIAAENVTSIYDAVLTGFAAKLNNDQLDALKADKAVRFIEKDLVWNLDIPYISLNDIIGGKNTIQAQSTPWGITAVGTGGSPRGGVKVWIIDTGIDLDHTDLNVNTSLSRSFVTGGRDSRSADDGNGHGSHVSGIIGAKNNTFGVVGVAPGVTLVAVKVLNSQGSGTTTAILNGLNYVAQNAADGDVVNMSLGYNGVVTSVDQATYNCSVYGGKNIYISIAAGNSSADANGFTPARVGLYYGTTLTSNIVSVSASDINSAFAYFSNYGTPVEWCAPGVSIYSCYKNNGYATMSGTSMAAPHVAGIMAVTGGPGTIQSSGYVSNDPDGNADPLAHR